MVDQSAKPGRAGGALPDVAWPKAHVARVRPNQLFATAMRPAMKTAFWMHQYYNSANTELLTELQAPLRLVKKRYFCHHQNMEQDNAIEAFAALAQPSRMRIFRLLVRAGPKGVQVGEISRRLDIVTSTLSGHLSILRRADLLRATRHQREIHYAANLAVVNDLIGFLLADCCEGQSENCLEILSLL